MKPPVIPVPLASAVEVAHKERYRVNLSDGQTQCPYRYRAPRSDSALACVLREGHPGMHCHAYVTPSPTSGWLVQLSKAEAPIRAALERLAESPRELHCYVIVDEPLTGRFVQFCTPAPPSRFVESPRIATTYPLIFDGTGKRNVPEAYQPFRETCDVDFGVHLALDFLEKHLPPGAGLRIVEESTQQERPS